MGGLNAFYTVLLAATSSWLGMGCSGRLARWNMEAFSGWSSIPISVEYAMVHITLPRTSLGMVPPEQTKIEFSLSWAKNHFSDFALVCGLSPTMIILSFGFNSKGLRSCALTLFNWIAHFILSHAILFLLYSRGQRTTTYRSNPACPHFCK